MKFAEFSSSMRLTKLVALSGLLVFSSLVNSCNSNDQDLGVATGTLSQLSMQGIQGFRDGSTVAAQAVQYRLTLSGTGFFQPGVRGCKRSDPHMEGFVDANLPNGFGGSYAVDFSIGNATSITDVHCKVGTVDPSTLGSVRLDASILADAQNCESYCVARGQPEAACASDCSQGSRILLASRTLAQGELQKLEQAAGSSNRIIWNQDLVFDTLGPPISQAGGPDLQVDADAATDSISITEETFAADDCAMIEECVGAPGKRKLLRFDGTIRNLGTGDLVLGDPTSNPLFEYSACHNHYHLKDMMLYELLDASSGQAVVVGGSDVVGRKQGFCMMDIFRINNSSPIDPKYDCENQGISAGWADIYDSTLDCQWLDITSVPAGDYTLRITVNPNGIFSESDTSNNSASIPVSIP
jgi:hypothetical protein